MKRLCLIALLALPLIAHAQLMDPVLQARLEKALPQLSNYAADAALHGRTPGKRLFYTGSEIEHAQQDHDFTGGTTFHLSAHNRSARKDGLPGTDNEFPWKHPGGTSGEMVYAWKVMYLPPGTRVEVHRATLKSFFVAESGPNFVNGRGNHDLNGYDWTFPVGTRFYELLSFADRLSVFEVRMRTKVPRGTWRANVFRPFVTREEFVAATAGEPQAFDASRFRLHDRLLHRNRYAFDVAATVEEIPGFETAAEADVAMRRTFVSTMGRDWSDSGAAAPWTRSETAIVPKDYDGTFVGNTQESCARCHQDAAVHVRFFDANREWYGAVRGSLQEKILSFHPMAPEALSRTGGRVPVILNRRLVDAGLVEWRKP